MDKCKSVLSIAFLAFAVSLTFFACSDGGDGGGSGGSGNGGGSGDWCYSEITKTCISEESNKLLGKSCDDLRGELVDDCTDYGFEFCNVPSASCSAMVEGQCATLYGAAGGEVVESCDDKKPSSSSGKDEDEDKDEDEPSSSSVQTYNPNIDYAVLKSYFGDIVQGPNGCMSEDEAWGVWRCQWPTNCSSLNEMHPDTNKGLYTCEELIKNCIISHEGLSGIFLTQGANPSEVSCIINDNLYPF